MTIVYTMTVSQRVTWCHTGYTCFYFKIIPLSSRQRVTVVCEIRISIWSNPLLAYISSGLCNLLYKRWFTTVNMYQIEEQYSSNVVCSHIGVS
jgi:hypothetical protein